MCDEKNIFKKIHCSNNFAKREIKEISGLNPNEIQTLRQTTYVKRKYRKLDIEGSKN